jgi:hypothetical protein
MFTKKITIMTINEQDNRFSVLTKRMHNTIISKRGDYATKDVLSNFKVAGGVCQLSPEMQCLSAIATKVARLGVLLSTDSRPNNESISDSVLDLANYAILLDMLIIDRAGSKIIF